MQREGLPARDLVLVGCGHAHLAVLRRFGMRPMPGVRLTLVTPEVEVPYSGMLPGVVEGLYAPDEALVDAWRLARFAGARLFPGEATGLDAPRRLLHVRGRPPVPYDVLSLNLGVATDLPSVPGAAGRAVPVRPLGGLLAAVEAALERLRAVPGGRLAVVGAGAGGVELLLALERRLRGAAGLLLVPGAGGVLPGFPERLRRRVLALLRERGVAVAGSPAAAVLAGALRLADGTTERADEVLWAAGAAPPAWLRETGLPLDDAGFLRVDACLRAEGGAEVFAAGDAAAFGPRALPRSGVYAVRAGPVLARNLRRALLGRPLVPFRPQRRALALLSLGGGRAIGARGGLVVEGAAVWRWKRRLDRRFVARFGADLPEMRPPAPPPVPFAEPGTPPEPAMRCGGCGAKVGAGALRRALSGLRVPPRPEVVQGLEAPDDAALLDLGGPRLLAQSIDGFRAMIDDPYRFGRIAAVHALNDLHATGAEPCSALALATVPHGSERMVAAELSQLMAGAAEALAEAGCALVGGHSAEGAELSLGLAVTGAVPRDAVLRKAGARPGDALVLCKPLGTGVLLAALATGRARGRWVEAALSAMAQGGAAAARVLRAHGARAATDVTGFGLLGHLREMMEAAGTRAVLDAAAVPLLEGAAWCAAAGVRSSLAERNAEVLAVVADAERVRAMPSFPLLCDPQTAGGLLAAVPGEEADRCVAALRGEGYRAAAVIGRVEAGSGVQVV